MGKSYLFMELNMQCELKYRMRERYNQIKHEYEKNKNLNIK